MRNHLFIGLGGQGGRTLAELRKVMAQRQRDTAKLKQAGVEWDFLAIDSSNDVRNELKTWKYFGEDLSLQEQDWLPLRGVSPADVDQLAIQDDVAKWIGNRTQIQDFVQNNTIEGANQRRRFGRILFAKNADEIRRAIFTQKVGRMTATGQHACTFHVFASLAGGTGSGCIVDLIATIRSRYPAAELNAYPIFVYVYATHTDGAADVGYFFQNQFAALRDLNALICDKAQPPLKLHLLGNEVAGQLYAGSDPIAQLVVSTSLNLNNMGVPISNQIRIVAESCFERIFAWSTGHMSADTQKSITGQDIISSFPGEPIANTERSYRFAGMGMRRWEVPHQKMKELLALDVLASSVRQMLFSNWENNKGYSDSLPKMGSATSASLLEALDRIISEFLLSPKRTEELTRKLREDVDGLAKGMLKEGGSDADLTALEARAKSYYEQGFQQSGVLALFQTFQRNQAAQIDDVVLRLDQALSSLWLDAANPVALCHIPELLDTLDATLRAKLETGLDHSAAEARVTKLLSARRAEWAKITFLAALVGKQKDLFTAQARDLGLQCGMDLQKRAEEIDAKFLRGVLAKFPQLKSGYQGAQNEVTEILQETEREIRDINVDLQQMRQGDGPNKYEFNGDSFEAFLPKMRAHLTHQRDSAQSLRNKVNEALNGRPLTALKTQSHGDSQQLTLALRESAMERAMAMHQALELSGAAPRILEESLLGILEARLGGNDAALGDEVLKFVRQAASCLHLRTDAQPATLLGQGLNIPSMPKRILLLGLPNDNVGFANRLKELFINARGAGTHLTHDTYSHDDPTQLRLLFVDYWLAARFTTVAHELAARYRTVGEGPIGGDTAYFCNLDPAGEEGKRPSLFLPTPEEMRSRFKAELWLAMHPDVAVVESNKDGVFVVRGAEDENKVPTLGADLSSVESNPGYDAMFRLHNALGRTINGDATGGVKKTVTDLVANETERIRKTAGPASSEYREWLVLRNHLQKLVL